MTRNDPHGPLGLIQSLPPSFPTEPADPYTWTDMDETTRQRLRATAAAALHTPQPQQHTQPRTAARSRAAVIDELHALSTPATPEAIAQHEWAQRQGHTRRRTHGQPLPE
ncbi:hypothetical protein [Kocuria palustris]|uniref:hypothetical protein n=1 Tax=Kocuria palustris TaxID=71999 RepID=UPI003D757256